MKKSKKQIYKEEINVSWETDISLKSYFITHIGLYNSALKILRENPQLENFKEFTKLVKEYIDSNKITTYIKNSLYIELYYMFKFKDKVIQNKSISDIQYITFFVTSYNNNIFSIKDKIITFRFIPGYIELLKDLPEISGNDPFYFTISYSNIKDSYTLTIYN